jgi:sterol desaturase/sphingolipid hydroxylase (fatty acid hydroxylase superfamily)
MDRAAHAAATRQETRLEYEIFHPILDRYGVPFLLALSLFLLFAQFRWPLRPWRQEKRSRLITNAAVGIPAMLAFRLALIPAVLAAAYWAQSNGFGLLRLFGLPVWLQALLAFVLIDYSLYVWHVLNHKVRFLWRFHNVHHTDLDLGLSTAIRFHFGEMLLSALFRAAAVLLIGAGPVVVLVYEIAFQTSVAFHHSNWRLPFGVERALNHVLVTPRMHGIHHSIVHRETDSNYSNLFVLWDRLHGTIRLDIPQDEVTIGVPAYRQRSELGAGALLLLPFRRQRDDWTLPDGTHPDRPPRGDREALSP